MSPVAALGTGRRVVGVASASIGGLIGALALGVRLVAAIDHRMWGLAVLVGAALAGTLAVAALLAMSYLGRDGEVARSPEDPTWADRVGPVMIGVISVGILVATSGTDLWWGYLPVGLLVAWCLTLSLLARREQARALWGLILTSLAATVIGAIGVPATMRLRLAEDEIIAAGSQVLAGEAPTGAGSYRFVATFVDGDCAVMVTQEMMLFSQYGVAYCDGSPDSGSSPTNSVRSIATTGRTDRRRTHPQP